MKVEPTRATDFPPPFALWRKARGGQRKCECQTTIGAGCRREDSAVAPGARLRLRRARARPRAPAHRRAPGAVADPCVAAVIGSPAGCAKTAVCSTEGLGKIAAVSVRAHGPNSPIFSSLLPRCFPTTAQNNTRPQHSPRGCLNCYSPASIIRGADLISTGAGGLET